MNKTGNPVGSKAFLDFEDNVEILDKRLTSDEPVVKDRLGNPHLSWVGIELAGSGDPGVIVPIVQQAVQDVVDGVDGQAVRAESAADRAVGASNSAANNADIRESIDEAINGPDPVEDGQQFQVLSENGLEYIRYKRSGSSAIEVGKFPSTEKINNLEEAASRVGESDDVVVTHAFTDSDNKLLAYIDDKGEFDLHPTENTVERISRIKKNADEGLLFALLDSQDRIVWFVDKHGNTPGGISQSQALPAFPIKDVSSEVGILKFERYIEKLDIKTTAVGRTGDPDVEINGDGLTHPKMLYVPEGWNGYKYWLAATPTFGVTPNFAYENPHVWASNDLISWVEPAGGAIDRPEDGNSSYWSDTHLALDDDGWMYCIYRGQGFTFGMGRCIVAKRSRDGSNWSERITIYNTDNEPLSLGNMLASPSIFKAGTRWTCVDIVEGSSLFPIPENNYSENRAVFRRSSSYVVKEYEAYNVDQIVSYLNRGWGAGKEPWHIDAVQVGNLHLHLVNVGNNGASYASEIYLAWSRDGWNFKVLPRLDTEVFNIYRSSICVTGSEGNQVSFDVVVARTNGVLDLYRLKLEVI